jgi:hypothetical protein
LIRPRAEFFGFVKVEFDLRPPGIGGDGRGDFQLEIGRQQIPGLELRQLRDDDDDLAYKRVRVEPFAEATGGEIVTAGKKERP